MSAPVAPTLLMIEDNELNTEMLRRRLEKRGYHVVCEADGQNLHVLLQQFRPVLILMDLSLPGIDGWTLAGEVKAKEETRDIPIIAVTAHAMPGDRDKALQSGCDDYITKPVDFQMLLGKIDHWLRLTQDNAPAPPEAGLNA